MPSVSPVLWSEAQSAAGKQEEDLRKNVLGRFDFIREEGRSPFEGDKQCQLPLKHPVSKQSQNLLALPLSCLLSVT